jgi:hypothetical protein
MSIFTVELETYESGEIVIAEVEFAHHKDSDPRPYGEGTVWENTSFNELIDVRYFLDDNEYKPTKEDLKLWNKIIDRELNLAEAA